MHYYNNCIHNDCLFHKKENLFRIHDNEESDVMNEIRNGMNLCRTHVRHFLDRIERKKNTKFG